MTRDLNKYGKSIKSEASRSAAAVYRSFRVLPYEEGEVEEPRHGFRKGFVQKRVKELSDRIMGFSEDTAWREMMQKQGKKGKYVRNCGGGDEDEDDGDHERLRPGQ